jgi:hypothetical protein
MGHGGKGDTPRPISVDQNTFASNWEAIFGKKKKEVVDTQQLESTVDKEAGEHLPRDSNQGG